MAITYQALWAASESNGEGTSDDEAPLVELIRSSTVATVVLDEAHHLRQSWWRVIQGAVKDTGVRLVSLTATPPYDAPGREWRRYEELCGPVDEEVAAPELVRSGTLAPHQDFVYLAPPGPELARTVQDRDRSVDEVLARLEEDADFMTEVLAHPWVQEDPPVAAVLDAPHVAAALLAFLAQAGREEANRLRELLGLAPGDAPILGRRMWHALLHEYLFGSSFNRQSQPYREALAAELRSREILWRRELRIHEHRDVQRSLSLSASKVGACVDVHLAELATRRAGLRQAILTDFIRDEVLGAPPGQIPVELGAIPVFDALVSVRDDPSRIAVLTGRIQIVHSILVEALAALAGELEHPTLANRPGWIQVSSPQRRSLVDAFTSLLAAGAIDTIVGTRSLLGQGWDAPCLNSVILASSVGSFVSTNQMRGRALRSDPLNPEKVASIWHLAALLPDTATGVADVELLRDRFRTFTGPSWGGDVIESGYSRLELAMPTTTLGIADFNRSSVERLQRLDEVSNQWQALTITPLARVRPTVTSPPQRRVFPVHVQTTLRHLVRMIVRSGVGVIAWRLAGLTTVDSLKSFAWLFAGIAVASALAVGPDLVRAVRLAVRHLPVDGSLHAMGRAVLRALQDIGLVPSEESLDVRSQPDPDGTVHLALTGGDFRAQQLFADAMTELLGPVENPRYLITRASRRRGGPKDAHPVPGVLGVNRESAEALLARWREFVGPGELMYTRGEGGREVLLRARAQSFSTNYDPRQVGRLDRWT